MKTELFNCRTLVITLFMQTESKYPVEEYLWRSVKSQNVVTNNQVLGNYIGTDSKARNLISGNESSGITISGKVALGNQVLGNYIVTDATGSQSLELFALSGEPTITGIVDIGFSSAHEPFDENKVSLGFYQQDLARLQKQGDRSGQANTLCKIGQIYEKLDQQQKALDSYQQALEIYRELGDLDKQAKTLSEIGDLYYCLNRDKQALESYKQALQLYRELGDRPKQAEILSSIAESYHLFWDLKKALKSYQQELQIYRELGDWSGVADTLSKIEKFYYAIGQNDKGWYFHLRYLAIRTQMILQDTQETIAGDRGFSDKLPLILGNYLDLQRIRLLFGKPNTNNQIDNLTCWSNSLQERQREKTIDLSWPVGIISLLQRIALKGFVCVAAPLGVRRQHAKFKFSLTKFYEWLSSGANFIDSFWCAGLRLRSARTVGLFLQNCSNLWHSLDLLYRNLLFPSSAWEPAWAMAGSGSPQLWQMSDNLQSSKVTPAASSSKSSKKNEPENEELDPPLSALEEDILTALGYKERYGLEIIEVIERASEGTRKLGPGSLYPTLRRLQKKGYLESRWGDDDDGTGERGGARRRYYKVSDRGLKKLQQTRSFRERLILASGGEQILAGA